jgi:hypothetical protein
MWRSDKLGNVDSYTLTSLPAGFNLNHWFSWEVHVNTAYGEGQAFWSNGILVTDYHTALPGLDTTPFSTPGEILTPLLTPTTTAPTSQ